MEAQTVAVGHQEARHQIGVPLRVPARWIARGITLFAVLLLSALFLRTLQTSPFVDFEAYYSGALAIRSGAPLYERALAYRDAGYSLNHPGIPEPVPGMPYAYPPAFAIAFIPISLLPLHLASVVWFLVVASCLIGAAHVLAGLLIPTSTTYRIALPLGLTAALGIFQPTRSNLTCGQVELLIFLLLVLSLAAFVRGQDYRAGLWLALAASIKPAIGFFVLYFLWKRAYRSAAVAVGLSTVLLLGPVLALGPTVLVDFTSVAAHWSSTIWAVGPINQAPYGLLLRLLTANPYTTPLWEAPALAMVLRWAVVGMTLAALMCSISRSRRQPVSQIVLEFGLMVAGMLLVAPLAQDIYLIHLAIPLLGVIVAVGGARRLHWSSITLGAAALALYVYLSLPSLRLASHAYYQFYTAPITWPTVLLTGAHTYGVIAVGILTLVTLRWHARVLTAAHGRHARMPEPVPAV